MLTDAVEFICVHRDRVGSGDLRDKLLEDHWSYMDAFGQTMIARGPLFASDVDLTSEESDDAPAAGSVHVLDLPDARRRGRRFR